MEVHLSIFIFVVPLLFQIAGYFKEYTVAFLSIALHEMGHMAAAHFYGYEPSCLKLTPVGFSVSINDIGCPRLVTIVIYSAGPAVNLLVFISANVAALVFPAMEDFWRMAAVTNILFGLFNLIPVYPLDGGRILLEFLAGYVGLLAAGRMLRRLALVISIAILLVGAYQLYITAFNFSLIIIGLYIIALLKTGRMESALMNIKQIIYRRTRLLKKGLYPARDLVVVKSTLLSEILKNMDFDRFHLVYVLDENMRLLRVFTENEIMDAIVESGDNMTFELLLESIANKSPVEKIL